MYTRIRDKVYAVTWRVTDTLGGVSWWLTVVTLIYVTIMLQMLQGKA